MLTGILGEQIASYRIEGTLGCGGTSRVYLGRHVRSGQPAAIKLAHVSGSDAAGMRRTRKHFERESESLALLAGCRHVVDLLDSGHLASGRPYLVLEWVHGWNLDRELDKGGGMISPRRASGMISQICAALQAAHDLGIVHLDLKPQNLLLRRAEHPDVVLLDFGISRRVGQHGRRSGWIEGSPLFMAPEQLAGQHDQLGPAADIYALGVVAYLMLCGELPFELNKASDILEVISIRLDRARAPIPLAQRAPRLPVQLCGLVDSCLATDPIARPSAAGFGCAFAQAAGGRHDLLRHEAGRASQLALAQTLCLPAGVRSPTGVALRAAGSLC